MSAQDWMEQQMDLYLPHVSIDCVVFGFHENQLRVLLLRFKNTEVWALPGGRVYREEPVDTAAVRVLEQRTGLSGLYLQQFHSFGDPDRLKSSDFQAILDRQGVRIGQPSLLFDRTISVGYYALVEFAQVNPAPDLLSDECRWWDIRDLPKLFFDHNEIVAVAVRTLRQRLSYEPLGLNLLPEKFTMPELQRLYETLLGQPLDRRNFQKRMLAYDFLQRLDERRTGGAYKAPYLYRFDRERYAAVLQGGGLAFG